MEKKRPQLDTKNYERKFSLINANIKKKAVDQPPIASIKLKDKSSKIIYI